MNKGRMIVLLLFVLFILSFIPMRTQASGSGDYPPPVNGDWNITVDTVVENETILLNGNLTVQNGASLTFENVTLLMNCTASAQWKIDIRNGSTFTILDLDYDNTTSEDASVITAVDSNYNFLFLVREQAVFEMRNSNLHECGQGYIAWQWNPLAPQGAWYGLCILTDNAIIEYNNISNNRYGVVCWDSDAIISNNTIENNDKAGVMATVWSNGTIENNRIIGNLQYGIWVDGWSNTDPQPSNPIVRKNYIYDSGQGSQVANGLHITVYSKPVVEDNQIINSTEDGIYCGQWCEVTIRNTTIQGGNFGIVGGGACRDVTIINCSISGANFFDLSSNSQSYFHVINSTFGTSECDGDPASITVKWYLHVRAEDQAGLPISGATVVVRNESSVEKYNRLTNVDGVVKWMVVTEYVDQNVSGSTIRTYHTPHEVEVTYGGFTFSNNPRSVDMDSSKTEVFVSNEFIPEFTTILLPILFILFINIFYRKV
ncbi:MAG: right-handed parallel beta-helix repeat-containing protein [Thermoplasmata archaeon]